jgi:hypothetical protein
MGSAPPRRLQPVPDREASGASPAGQAADVVRSAIGRVEPLCGGRAGIRLVRVGLFVWARRDRALPPAGRTGSKGHTAGGGPSRRRLEHMTVCHKFDTLSDCYPCGHEAKTTSTIVRSACAARTGCPTGRSGHGPRCRRRSVPGAGRQRPDSATCRRISPGRRDVHAGHGPGVHRCGLGLSHRRPGRRRAGPGGPPAGRLSAGRRPGAAPQWCAARIPPADGRVQ